MHIIMFNLSFSFLIFIVYILTPSESQDISIGWQSLTQLSSEGFEFSPVNEQALLLSVIIASSISSCTRLCHSIAQCRIFDFDGQSHRCRIFEGNITTMGSIITSSSSQSRVGSIKLGSEQFANHGQSCSSCQGSRYLTCINGSCQCQTHTYFDGSICESEKLLGSDCSNSSECRSDLNYICLSRQQCGPVSIQTATVVGGYGNGTAGSSLNALRNPGGFSVGVDNSLYISDYLNHRVIKLPEGSLFGSIVAGTGVAGSTASQLNGPAGLYIDASLNIYVADSNNYRIMFWRKNSSVGVKVAGTGSSGSSLSSFGILAGLFVDSQGNIYACDANNNRVMKFTPNSTAAVIVAGTGFAGNGNYQLNVPYDLYIDEINSYLYVTDYNNHRIQYYQLGVSTNGTTVAGGNGQGAGSNQLNFPSGLCVSKTTKAIYIADSGNNRIQRWSSGATSGVTIAGNGALNTNSSTSVQGYMGIRQSINESYLFVSETSYNTVWSFELI